MALLQCEICGGKLKGRPGGIYECEFCGVEYDTAWAKAKIQEIKGTVKVEGTVQVAGAVKIDGPVKIEGSVSAESLLKRGQLALEEENWETASEYFEKTLDANPECAEAYFGLAMCSAMVKSHEELVQFHQWEDKNYCLGKRFADSALKQQTENLERAYITELNRVAENPQRLKLQKLREKSQLAASLIATSGNHTVARKANGGAVAMATEDSGDSPIYYEPRLWVSNWQSIVAVSAGHSHSIGLKDDGTVVATGSNKYHQCGVSRWENIVAVCAGDDFSVGLQSDGKVVMTGNLPEGLQTGWNSDVVSTESNGVLAWSDVVSMYAGYDYFVGLKKDGSVMAAGKNNHGQCNVINWQDISAISVGGYHTVGLKSDGTVVATGDNGEGQCDVSGWQDIVAISASLENTVGLRSDGRVVAAGSNEFGQCNVKHWRNIIAISSNYHTVGLTADGKVVAAGENGDVALNVKKWKNIVAIRTNSGETIGLNANGELLTTDEYHCCYCSGGKRLFQSFDTLEQELDEANKARKKREEEERIARQKREEEERLARQKREEEERLVRQRQEERERIARLKRKREEHLAQQRREERAREYRSAGLCQDCGGQFKGLFSKKCSVCGKPKDY